MDKAVAPRALGSAYALAASALIAAQAPLSSPAAKQFSAVEFIFFTQVALLASVPLLLISHESRRDLWSALSSFANYGKLAAIFAVSTAGLVLYNVSLSHAHPVVVVAILSLAPFWGALIALILTRTPIPVSPFVFFACLAVAFVGAVAVAWSQAKDGSGLVGELLKGSWLFALPIPIFTVLSASLITKWFSNMTESGAVAVNILFGCVVLIPATAALLIARREPILANLKLTLLMIAGIVLADSIGRVFYQKALSATDNDNGFVTMFQNLEPAIAALIAFCLSPWIAGLRFQAGWLFFAGLGLTGLSLCVFSWRSLRQAKQPAPPPGRRYAVRL
jgi:drug/metabolite transporter (DMT)-like permease